MRRFNHFIHFRAPRIRHDAEVPSRAVPIPRAPETIQEFPFPLIFAVFSKVFLLQAAAIANVLLKFRAHQFAAVFIL